MYKDTELVFFKKNRRIGTNTFIFTLRTIIDEGKGEKKIVLPVIPEKTIEFDIFSYYLKQDNSNYIPLNNILKRPVSPFSWTGSAAY